MKPSLPFHGAEHDGVVLDQPNVVGDREQADRLAGERLADEDLLCAPFDATVVAHVADREAAVPVGDREQLHIRTVAGQEPALEIRSPHVVRRPTGGKWRDLYIHPPPANHTPDADPQARP